MTVLDPVEVYGCLPSEPRCLELLERLDAYLAALYAPEQNHILSVSQLLAPEVSFVAARDLDAVVGCGALVRRGREYAEIKRMFVDPGARGKRIGKRILQHLESLATDEGFTVLRLETGNRQPEALALYERAGYRRTGPFGEYGPNETSVFMQKTLPPAP
ncbi:MAG: GNAT family N-acetyltransferase [Terriglobales bacterium]